MTGAVLWSARQNWCSPAREVLIFFNDTATTEIYTLSLHDALPISQRVQHTLRLGRPRDRDRRRLRRGRRRSEEHTSELQSLRHLVCRLLLEIKNQTFNGSMSSLIAVLPRPPPRHRILS